MFLSNYGTQKSPRVLIVQSTRAINLFQLIKLLKPWNYFCFCILSVDWRSSKTERQFFSAELKMAAPGSHANKNSTQINKRRMTKQHSSSMYVGLLSTSALPFFFSLLSLSRSKSLKLLVSLLAGQSVHPRESTISMQLGSVVYKKIKSKHRFREFTKQTWTTLLLTWIPLLLSCVMPNGNSCRLFVLPPTKLFALGDAKWLQKGNMSSRKRIAV